MSIFFEREKLIYSRIVNSVANHQGLGKSFCNIPDTVVKELQANGYQVHLIQRKNFKRHVLNVLVCRPA